MRRWRTAFGVWIVLLMASGARAQTEHVYELTIEGKRVGYSRYTTTKTPAGLATTAETVIKVSLLGAPFDMRYDARSLHSSDGRRLLRYKLAFSRGDQRTDVEATVKGTNLTCSLTTSGKTTKKTLAWAQGSYLIEGNSMDTWNMLFGTLGRATPKRIRAFTPLAGAVQTLAFSRGAVTATNRGSCDVYRTGQGAETVELLVSRRTREVVEMRVPAQKAVFRLADASALSGIRSYDPGSKLFSIVNVPLPDPEKLTSLKVRARIEVAGEKPTASSLQSSCQKFQGKATSGLVEGTFELTHYRYSGVGAPRMKDMPPKDPTLAVYLKPEPNVECDDPEVRALARKIVEGSDSAWEAVQRIGAWIKENITYRITGSGALECLRTRKGDCGPHAWLTIALCRAAGIPARITGGVLYSRALGGSFGQHYWTRVWMGPAGWVPIDTTTHEVGTLSPAHITLWNLAGLKSVKVEVLDYAPKPAGTDTAVASPSRRTYRPAVGDREQWDFTLDGKHLGMQRAECVAVRDDGGHAFSEWRYEITLTPPGPAAQATVSGTFSIWSDATPRKLTFETGPGAGGQRGVYEFSKESVQVDLTVGETRVQRSLPLKPGQPMQMNNLLTAFSLATRSLGIQAGRTLTAPFFAASTLQSVDMTFTAQAEPRTLEVMGRSRSCLVCDVEPIKNRFYLDAETGELLRVEAGGGKLVIERVAPSGGGVR